MMQYLRFLILPTLIILALWASVSGHHWILIYLVLFNGFIVIGDALLGEDAATPTYHYPQFLTGFLYLSFPLSCLLLSVSAYMTGAETLPFFESFMGNLFNTNLVENRDETSWWHLIGYVWVSGLILASGGTLTGYELVHHKNVGTKTDPATAREGEPPFRFFVRATLREHRNAWHIERTHLKRRGHSFFSVHNQMLIGYLRSIIVTAWLFFVGGVSGVFLFLFIILVAKLVLEIVNYMEHYELVRISGTPVESRHSWNSTKRLSSLLLYNLTRHSHHHEKGGLEFWKLKSYIDTPQVPYGYLSTLYFALFFPNKFRQRMKHKLDEWYLQLASQDEKKLRLVI
jgi:alkane 1-monooxygenase